MNKSEINPPENKLHEGLNVEELIRSITTSGFPLQGVVANLLKSNYGVTLIAIPKDYEALMYSLSESLHLRKPSHHIQ